MSKLEKVKQLLRSGSLAYVAAPGSPPAALTLESDGVAARDSSGKIVALSEILRLLGMPSTTVYGARGLPKQAPDWYFGGSNVVLAMYSAARNENPVWGDRKKDNLIDPKQERPDRRRRAI